MITQYLQLCHGIAATLSSSFLQPPFFNRHAVKCIVKFKSFFVSFYCYYSSITAFLLQSSRGDQQTAEPQCAKSIMLKVSEPLLQTGSTARVWACSCLGGGSCGRKPSQRASSLRMARTAEAHPTHAFPRTLGSKTLQSSGLARSVLSVPDPPQCPSTCCRQKYQHHLDVM